MSNEQSAISNQPSAISNQPKPLAVSKWQLATSAWQSQHSPFLCASQRSLRFNLSSFAPSASSAVQCFIRVFRVDSRLTFLCVLRGQIFFICAHQRKSAAIFFG
jgi:hypothetical protein